MLIQINTDKNITVHPEYNNKLSILLEDELERFSSSITRIELYLSDHNGPKKGIDDKKCALEVRIAGRKPVAVTDLGNTYDLAVKGAIEKVKGLLDKAVGKE